MKKLLSIFAALLCAGITFAETVELNFITAEGLAAMGVTPAVVEEGATQGSGVDFSTATVDNLVVTADKGSGSKAPNVFTNKDQSTEFRVYKGNTLTFTAQNETEIITDIEFDGTSLKFTELTDKKWSGRKHSVTINTTEDTGTRYVRKITVTLTEGEGGEGEGGEGGEDPKPYEPDTIGVSAAIELIKSEDPLAAKAHYVKGIVAGDPFTLGANGPAFYLTDIANPADSLEGFKINKNANTPYADINAMAADFGMGDTILIYANSLTLYNNKIYETTGGYFVKVLGKVPSLDWEKAIILREEGKWILTISDTQSEDYMDLVFMSSKENSISGTYDIAEGSKVVIGGVTSDATSGNVQFTYKKAMVDDNVYKVQATAITGDQSYRINKEYRIFAWDGEFPILLADDRPYVPQEGELLTCAQASEYASSLGSQKGVKVTVEGYITDVLTNVSNSFWMDDKTGSAHTIEVFKYVSFSPADMKPQKGQKVRVKGYAEYYAQNNVPELTSATVEVISGQAVDNVRNEATAVKFIENGQLYILRDGVRYNVQGQIVK